MTLTPKQREDLIRRYEQGPVRLKAALAKVPAEAMKWRPAEGKWSAHEVVCHLADSESNAALRIRYL
ncbi:MAG TPA: DinB family protein, partial [Thermoanaerobaculia bacterium]|nr:DinB family protein [Thermoanaerobaculia bacterium]